MPSKKPIFTLRTDKEVIDKLKEIAKEQGRSDNKQLEYILKKYIDSYTNTNKIDELKEDEMNLISLFRNSLPEIQKSVIILLEGGQQPTVQSSEKSQDLKTG